MRRFLSTSFVLFLGTTLSRAFGIAMVPLYSRTLTPSELGEYDVWFNSLTFAAPLVFAQIWDAVYRYSFHNDADRPRAINSGMAVMGLGLVLYSVAFPLILYALGPSRPGLVFAQGCALAANYFLGYVARSCVRNLLFAASGVLAATLNAGISSYLLVSQNQGIDALYIGYLVGACSQAALLAVVLRHELRPRPSLISRTLIWTMLRYTAPLCVATVAYWALSGFTRIAVAGVEGNAANGLFAIADRFGILITLALTALQMAWQEHLFTRRATRSAQAASTRALVASTLGAGSLLIVAASALFDVIIGAEFEAARTLVPMLIAAATLNGAATFIAGLFMAFTDTGPVLWSTAIAAGCNVALTLALLQLLGLPGAALSLATSFLVLLVVRMLICRLRLQISLLNPGVAVQIALLVLTTLASYVEKTEVAGTAAALSAASAVRILIKIYQQRDIETEDVEQVAGRR